MLVEQARPTRRRSCCFCRAISDSAEQPKRRGSLLTAVRIALAKARRQRQSAAS